MSMISLFFGSRYYRRCVIPDGHLASGSEHWRITFEVSWFDMVFELPSRSLQHEASDEIFVQVVRITQLMREETQLKLFHAAAQV